MIDVSTQTTLDATPSDISHDSSLSETKTGTKTPSTHTFLELTAPILRSTVREEKIHTQSMEHETTPQQLADTSSQSTGSDGEIEQYKARLAEMTESRDQQCNEIQTKLDEANIYIAELSTSQSILEEKAASAQAEVDDLRAALGEARSRVSRLEVERDNDEILFRKMDSEMTRLREDAVMFSQCIRMGCHELKGLLRLSARLYNRLREAEQMKGAEGWNDRLMRSAVEELARYNVLVEPYPRDVVSTEDEEVSDLDLAIVRRPADYSVVNQAETGYIYEVSADDSELEKLVDEIYGAAEIDGDVSGVEAAGPTSENAEVEQDISTTHPKTFRANVNMPYPTFGASTPPSGAPDSDNSNFPSATGFNFRDTATSEAGPSSSSDRDDPHDEEPRVKSRKTSKTASIFAAAAGIDLSSSSPSSAAKGKQKEGRTPAFGQEGSRIFSFAPSEDGVREEQTTRYHDPEATSPSFNFSSANTSNFFAGTTKGKEKEEPTPIFGAEGSSQFSFSPASFAPTFGESGGSSPGSFTFSVSSVKSPQGGEPGPKTAVFGAGTSHPFSFTPGSSAPAFGSVGAETSHPFSFTPGSSAPTFGSVGAEKVGEDEQKRESTDKATENPPLFSAEAIARFDSGPSSGRTFDFGNVNFPTMGVSEAEADSSHSLFSPASAVAPEDDGFDELYDIEPGYEPPAERLAVVDQAGGEQGSLDADDSEDADGISTGVPRITITPASTFDDKAEVGNANILERNGFDVAALSRIVVSGNPVAPQNLETATHGAESLLESLPPREGHYPSFADATGIQNVVWHGRGRTAKEIYIGYEPRSEVKNDNVEEDLALIISGIENLHLGSLPPSSDGDGPGGNEGGDGDDGCEAETEGLRDDEPQTKVVEEDVQATRAVGGQMHGPWPDKASSADCAVQPRIGLQVESTAPPSSSPSSSYSSSSSSSETRVSTPSATQAYPAPQRVSKNGNPMDQNGRVYVWKVRPLTRKKKSRASGEGQP